MKSLIKLFIFGLCFQVNLSKAFAEETLSNESIELRLFNGSVGKDLSGLDGYAAFISLITKVRNIFRHDQLNPADLAFSEDRKNYSDLREVSTHARRHRTPEMISIFEKAKFYARSIEDDKSTMNDNISRLLSHLNSNLRNGSEYLKGNDWWEAEAAAIFLAEELVNYFHHSEVDENVEFTVIEQMGLAVDSVLQVLTQSNQLESSASSPVVNLAGAYVHWLKKALKSSKVSKAEKEQAIKSLISAYLTDSDYLNKYFDKDSYYQTVLTFLNPETLMQLTDSQMVQNHFFIKAIEIDQLQKDVSLLPLTTIILKWYEQSNIVDRMALKIFLDKLKEAKGPFKSHHTLSQLDERIKGLEQKHFSFSADCRYRLASLFSFFRIK